MADADLDKIIDIAIHDALRVNKYGMLDESRMGRNEPWIEAVKGENDLEDFVYFLNST